jgi:hypothetical protein
VLGCNNQVLAAAGGGGFGGGAVSCSNCLWALPIAAANWVPQEHMQCLMLLLRCHVLTS